MTHGVWSDVSLERTEAMVFGSEVVQALEEKNQSNLSNRGFCCLLVHVNLQPFGGISVNLNLLITSLNFSISFVFPPGLFLFSGEPMKLKSHTISHFISSDKLISLNLSRNYIFPAAVQGA